MLRMSPNSDNQLQAPATVAQPELGFASLLHPAAAQLLWPSPNRYRHSDGRGGGSNILGGTGHDDKRLLLLATLTSLHSDATGKGSKSQQIILGSEGNSKSHVSLSLAKSCKADSSCPPLAFSPPLRVLLMKSLTPIWEIAVAKHALPCYQKSF